MSKLTEEEQKHLEEKMAAAPVATGDLAFDPTVARQCDRRGCPNDGELRRLHDAAQAAKNAWTPVSRRLAGITEYAPTTEADAIAA